MTARGIIGLGIITALAACAKDASDTSGGSWTGSIDTGPSFSPGDTSAYEGTLEFTGARPYNVLMISLDTTRVEDLGRFSGLDTTPNLDALFEKSVTLDNHRSCSNWTFASTVCVQSGGWDLDLGFVPGTGREPATVPDDILQAPEVLGDAGWSSYLVSTNSFLSSHVNNAQGFDGEKLYDTHQGEDADGAAVTERALDELETLMGGDDAWYLHAHYLDPHDPYTPPDEYLDELSSLGSISYDLTNAATVRELNANWDNIDVDERALIQQHIDVRYRGELAYVDAQIGALIDQAEAMGGLENTLVVFWTDHGEQQGEHGSLGHDYHLYDEVNRAVVSFYADNLTPQAWDGPTTHADIWPTILEILPWDFGAPFMGMPVGTRGDDDVRFGMKYTADDETVMFAEQNDKKLIYYWSGHAEYYDLSTDADELVDGFDPSDPDVQALWALMAPNVETMGVLYPETPASDPGI